MWLSLRVTLIAFGLGACAPAKPAETSPEVAVPSAPVTHETAPASVAEPPISGNSRTASGVESHELLAIDLEASGALSVNGRTIADDRELVRVAEEAHRKNPDVRAVLRADRDVTYGRLVQVIDLLRQASITQIAFGVDAVSP